MPFFYAAAAGKPCGGAPGWAMKCREPVRPGDRMETIKKSGSLAESAPGRVGDCKAAGWVDIEE